MYAIDVWIDLIIIVHGSIIVSEEGINKLLINRNFKYFYSFIAFEFIVFTISIVIAIRCN